MKKLLLILSFLLSIGVFAQSVYNGNGKTGFGGTIGNGSLTISDNGTNITFALATANAFNDILVVYFDTKSGGFANTNTLNDQADGGRSAVSGNSGSNASEVNFPSGFNADFALAWGNFGAVLFELAAGDNNSLIFKEFNSSTTSFTIPKTLLQIPGAVSFNLVGTYVAGSVFRSNEALVENIGDGAGGSAPNFGFSPITFNTAQPYPSSTLNLDLTAFSARATGKDVEVNWQLACRSGNFADLNLERSTDGFSFQSIYRERVSAERCNEPFMFIDSKTVGGSQYYRLKYTSADGETKVSNIAKVYKEPVASVELAMVPTLVNSTANIQVLAPAQTSIELRVLDMQGKIHQSQKLLGTGAAQQVLLNTRALAPGIYVTAVTTADGQSKWVRFMKQ